MQSPRRQANIYDQVHDVVIFGAGYAGLGALTNLLRRKRRVLLIDRRGDVAWESGRVMCTDPGSSDHPVWRKWLRHLQAHQALTRNCILPAAAEALATEALTKTSQVQLLFYVAPVAVEMQGDCLATVTLATRNGLERIAAKQFIDATEQGELLSLLPARPSLRQPLLQRTSLFFQKKQWADTDVHPIAGLEHVQGKLTHSCWDLERCLRLDLPGSQTQPRNHLLSALESTHEQLGDFMHEAVLTHSSMIPLPVYDDQLSQNDGTAKEISLPANVLCASPAVARSGAYETLASRFELGAMTADRLMQSRAATIRDTWRDQAMVPIKPLDALTADVVVAGLGTGGLMAAVAAGRQGRRVMAFDAMPFAGGVGSGAGIHVYYHGVRGGLQDELDLRIRQIMPLFGSPGQVQGYHPDARKIIADQMLQEAGVHVIQGVLATVRSSHGRVTSAIVCTEQGPVEIDAATWIDATGDGELSAKAGATFRAGRNADGQFHAFSQSSGRASAEGSRMQMFCLNYDAGHVDPTDSVDMTRARLLGVSHYVQSQYRADDHPTMIAPMLGIRQGRHIHTDYTLTLGDLINHTQFDDVVAYARCHYDSHAVDYELESDESLFWVWVCRQWHKSLHGHVPYRCLLPRGIENLWLACRALGVSQDAQYVLRMQRDMQRIGEVAGLAAAIASSQGCSSRQVDYQALSSLLKRSGALFETQPDIKQGKVVRQDDSSAEGGDAPADLWSLYQAGPHAHGDLVMKMLASDSPNVSWEAAAVMAMWEMPVAQARLCHAIITREDGSEHALTVLHTKYSHTHVPRWVTAVALLRICGNEGCLETLAALARDHGLVANVRTSIALTLQRIAMRSGLGDAGREKAIGILHQLLASDVPLTAGPPRRALLDVQVKVEPDQGYWRPVVREDFLWQMHWAIAAALVSLGAEVHSGFAKLFHDNRAIVRRAADGLSEARLSQQCASKPEGQMMVKPRLQGVLS